MDKQRPPPISIDLWPDAPRETLLQVIEVVLEKTARL